MAKVYNWQIGREMDYPYEGKRPEKQFAMIFDTNKCIACQTCTVACKTTWTPGRGQEYMYWNNVETKPYGYYPLGWDVNILDKLGVQEMDRAGLRRQDPLRRRAPRARSSWATCPRISTTLIPTSARTTRPGSCPRART